MVAVRREKFLGDQSDPIAIELMELGHQILPVLGADFERGRIAPDPDTDQEAYRSSQGKKWQRHQHDQENSAFYACLPYIVLHSLIKSKNVLL